LLHGTSHFEQAASKTQVQATRHVLTHSAEPLVPLIQFSPTKLWRRGPNPDFERLIALARRLLQFFVGPNDRRYCSNPTLMIAGFAVALFGWAVVHLSSPGHPNGTARAATPTRLRRAQRPI